jgi:antitoxin CptB
MVEERAMAEECAAGLRRLRWRARRGLLENDLVLERFFARHGAALTPEEFDTLARFLELPDGELLDLVLDRAEPQGALDTAANREMLARLRAA